MDNPLQSTQHERIEIDSLSSWAHIPNHENNKKEHEQLGLFKPLFPIRHDLNHKIYLWHGDILNIEVDAIVNTTNESLSDSSDLCGKILEKAGPNLISELKNLDGCRTGESKITQAYQLPGASYIIHTVGPRYNLKYKTAAENALHGCYRSILHISVENKLRTLAICVVNTPKRCYPKEEAAHVAFRTVRRCLEKSEIGDNIISIVFAVNNLEDYQIYNNILRLYFPRNNRDLIENKDKYPEDTKSINEVGATVISERKIRIAAFPSAIEKKEETKKETPIRKAIDTKNGLKDFMTPTNGTPDERLRKEQAEKKPKQVEFEKLLVTYERLLKSAKKDDLSDVAKRNCVFQSGVDSLGRPIIMLIGSRFPEKKDKIQVQRFTKYILRIIEPIMHKDFIIVYCHACITQPQEPEFGWLKLMYRFCEAKFLQHMSNFYIVHPSFWVKFTLKLLSPWMLATFKERMRFVNSLGELFDIFDQSIMRLPDFIYKYDQKENGSSYLAEDNPANEGL